MKHPAPSTAPDIRDAIASIMVTANATAGNVTTPPEREGAPVVTPLGADLSIAYVVAQRESLVYVREHHLEQIDGRRDKLARIGLRNLMKLAGERMEVRAYNNVYGVFLDGVFEASLTLLNDLWDKTLAGMVPNGLVMAMPSRDVLAFCDAESVPGRRELRELVDRVWADGTPDHALTRDLFCRREQRWQRVNGRAVR